MILIFSEEHDVSTDNVMAWLHYDGCNVTRINNREDNLISSIEINDTATEIKFAGRSLDYEQIKSVWFRRGMLTYASDFSRQTTQPPEIREQVMNLLQQEANAVSGLAYFMLMQQNAIGNPAQYNLNKPLVLLQAKLSGLKTPDLIITNEYKQLRRFKRTRKNIITKSMANNISINEGERSYATGTRSLEEIPDAFFYSLFQEKVRRYCEIRTFYLHDSFYSMAIFVTKDIDDARALDLNGNKARLVPFALPDEILQRLKKLTATINVHCGSIDMIMTETGEFYFLEINPVGQYDYLEYQCNYPISKIIAQKLASNEREAVN